MTDLEPEEEPYAAPRNRYKGKTAARRISRIPPKFRAEPAPGPPVNFYPDVYTFVSEFLASLYAHEVREELTSWRWCPEWFCHVQAVARLESLWKAWEVLRLDPGTGGSVWFRDHADPCMAALTTSDGPFSRCSPQRHRTAPALPLAPLPAGLSAHPTTAAHGAANGELEDTIRLAVRT